MADGLQTDRIRVVCPRCEQRHLMTRSGRAPPPRPGTRRAQACCRVEIRVYWNFLSQTGVLRVADVLGEAGDGIELAKETSDG